MTAAGEILLSVLRQGWTFIASLLVLVTVLGGLAQVFKMSCGVFFGSNFWVAEAVAGVIGVAVIVLVSFFSIPALAGVMSVAGETGCGPISEIGQFSAMLIGGIGSLRMLKGILNAVVSSSLGGSGGIANALVEIAETVFGMLLITVAAPVAAAFFGAC